MKSEEEEWHWRAYGNHRIECPESSLQDTSETKENSIKVLYLKYLQHFGCFIVIWEDSLKHFSGHYLCDYKGQHLIFFSALSWRRNLNKNCRNISISPYLCLQIQTTRLYLKVLKNGFPCGKTSLTSLHCSCASLQFITYSFISLSPLQKNVFFSISYYFTVYCSVFVLPYVLAMSVQF